jgi:hypothetical protein
MYDKLFKNCNIIYIKNINNFSDIVKYLKGKIIISDFKEINDICNLNGIVHVLNTNISTIPNEKIDCILSNKQDKQLESKVILSEMKIPIIYHNENDNIFVKWCGICHTSMNIQPNDHFNKYCSEKCMQSHNGFMKNFKPDQTKDLDFNNFMTKQREKDVVIEFEKNTSSNAKKNKNISDKFQKSIEKDAIRLEFSFKREDYRKEMRQPSLRKASVSDKKKKIGEHTTHNDRDHVEICKGITKKGDQCTNKSIGSSNFCGIMSHSIN